MKFKKCIAAFVMVALSIVAAGMFFIQADVPQAITVNAQTLSAMGTEAQQADNEEMTAEEITKEEMKTIIEELRALIQTLLANRTRFESEGSTVAAETAVTEAIIPTPPPAQTASPSPVIPATPITGGHAPAPTQRPNQSPQHPMTFSYNAAVEAAVALTGGGVVTEATLGFYQGASVYRLTVEFGSRRFQVFVNTGTGEVERFRAR